MVVVTRYAGGDNRKPHAVFDAGQCDRRAFTMIYRQSHDNIGEGFEVASG